MIDSENYDDEIQCEISKNQMGDAYAFFLRSINSLPPLTIEQTDDLLKEYQKTHASEIRNQIIEGNRRLVIHIAKQFTGNIKPESRKHSLALELFQEGSIALGNAIEGFRAGDGNSFSTFAFSCIRNRRLSYRQTKRPQIKAPAYLQKIRKEVASIQKEYAKTHTFSPSDEERIERSGGKLSQEDLDSLYGFYQRQIPISLEQTISAEEDAPTIGDTQADDSTPLPDQISLDKEEVAHISEARNALDSREKDILCSRIFEPKKTLRELSQQYGITIERCRQIESNAGKKVREYLKQFD